MGFLSFLSKKKKPEERPLDPRLIGQAYHATAPALPPVLGTYPVAGNGPNVLIELQQAARKRSVAQLSSAGTVASAPSPLVPRLRSKSTSIASVDVDTASLQSRPKSAGRRPRDTSRGPSSLLRWGSSRRNSSHARSEADRDTYAVAPPVPRIPIRHTRDGSSSMGSVKRPAFVDLLDAQSELKPSDFRTRLQAAGARDYGEDVAERNLGVNGVDLTSPAVKAFYALTGGAALAYRSDGSAVDVHGNMYNPGSIPVKLKDAAPLSPEASEELEWSSRRTKHSDQKRRSEILGTGRRRTDDTQRRQRSSAAKGPSEADDLDIKAAHRQASMSNRRNSLQEYVANTSSTRTKLRPLSMHPVGDPAPTPGIPRYRPRTSEGLDASSPERSPGLGSISKMKYRDDEQSLEEPRTIRGRRTSVAKKRSHHTDSNYYASSDEGDLNVAPPPGVGNRNSRRLDHQNYSRPTTQQSWNGTQEQHRDSRLLTRPSTSSGAEPKYSRSRSIGGSSVHGRPRLDDIIEHIPVRKSSLIPVNLSAITPTTSASGHSSSLVSPSDNHTANTSVDLSYHISSMIPPHNRKASAASARVTPTYISPNEEDVMAEAITGHQRGKSMGAAGARKSLRARTSNSNLDDYLSVTTDGSDIDSFVEKQRRRRRNGEQALFKDRDDLMHGLPGLIDGFDPPSKSRGHLDPTAQASSSRTRDPPRSSRSRIDRAQAPVYHFSSDDQDSEYLSDLDYDDSFRPSPRMLAALASDGRFDGLDLFDLLADMPDEKMDARTAVKLRKEIKRHKRIAALEKSDKSKGKRPVRQG